MSEPTAAALIIGNELLTGKVQDANVSVLARELFALGVALRRVVICSDEEDEIVADLDALRSRYDYVFTSGGIGPTHDDVTIAAVARAFDRPIERAPLLESLLRDYFGDACSEEHLRMAEVPSGALMVTAAGGKWPTVRVDNVFVLPGLPEIFVRKMPLLREHLVGGLPFLSRSVSTASDEVEIAAVLSTLAERFPSVAIGSYPRWSDGPERVKVTFDGRDHDQVAAAEAAFIAALPADRILG